MDGTQRKIERIRKVVRRFEGFRQETQLMATAYEWVMPWMRCGDGVGRADPEQGETGVARPRRATGA